MNENQQQPSACHPARIIGVAVVTTFCVVAITAALVYATEIFLILFLALLFGVFLTRASTWLAGYFGINYPWCLALVASLLILSTLAGFSFFGMQVNDQIEKASKHLDEAERKFREVANRYPPVKSVLSSTPYIGELVSSKSTGQADEATKGLHSETDEVEGEFANLSASPARSQEKSTPLLGQQGLRSTAKQGVAVLTGIFKTTFGLVVNSMLIFFVGLFLAVSPQSYRDGIVVLFPPARRDRTREVMNLMGNALWSWLIGRFGSMLVTGVGAGVLLLALGVPMAVTLGVVTALLTFVPNIGGLIALSLAVLFALPQGGSTVAMVIGGYMALQLIESYVVTPLIQQRQVSLPPALLIAFQVVMGVLFGFLGAAVASPLLAAAKIGIEESYVKDILESESVDD